MMLNIESALLPEVLIVGARRGRAASDSKSWLPGLGFRALAVSGLGLRRTCDVQHKTTVSLTMG